MTEQNTQGAQGDEQTVATEQENANLEHSQGGVTTRDDQLDAGVSMLPGNPREPQGPEDALGVGEKRGDYRERVERTGQHFESRPIEGGGQTVTRYVDRESGKEVKPDAKNAVEVPVDIAPASELVAQNPRTEQIGDAEGLKGGVDTDPAANPSR